MALDATTLNRARTMRAGEELQIPASEIEFVGERFRLKLGAYRQLVSAAPRRFLLRRDGSSGVPVFFAMKTRKPPAVGRGRMGR